MDVSHHTQPKQILLKYCLRQFSVAIQDTWKQVTFKE
jgi:hypothetical protein